MRNDKFLLFAYLVEIQKIFSSFPSKIFLRDVRSNTTAYIHILYSGFNTLLLHYLKLCHIVSRQSYFDSYCSSIKRNKLIGQIYLCLRKIITHHIQFDFKNQSCILRFLLSNQNPVCVFSVSLSSSNVDMRQVWLSLCHQI